MVVMFISICLGLSSPLLLAVTAIGLNALQRYEHTESVVIVYSSWAHILVTFFNLGIICLSF